MEYLRDDNKPVRRRPPWKQDKGMQSPAEVGCLPGFCTLNPSPTRPSCLCYINLVEILLYPNS